MHEKFPPQHQVQLDKLLNLDTSYSGTYGTRMSEAVRITTIQAGVIAQYNRSEREEISRLLKLNPDLTYSLIQSQSVNEFIERVKNAYEKIRGGEVDYQKITSKDGEIKETRNFEWTLPNNRLKTATITHTMNSVGESSNVINATFYNHNDAHLVFGR